MNDIAVECQIVAYNSSGGGHLYIEKRRSKYSGWEHSLNGEGGYKEVPSKPSISGIAFEAIDQELSSEQLI
jgi:hypothetical protein